jgi:hypothetical protein
MDAHNDTTSSIGDVITGAAEWMFALGVLTMTVFPFAIPGIVLTVAAVVPLVLLAVVGALLAAVAAAPAMAVRGLRRRAAVRRDRAGFAAATPQPS